jgi:hypothetical protein
MSFQEVSLPYYEQVPKFLAEGPSAQQISAFRPRPEAQERFSHLLDVNRQRTLTPQEEEELEPYIRIEQMMPLLKAKGYTRLDRRME